MKKAFWCITVIVLLAFFYDKFKTDAFTLDKMVCELNAQARKDLFADYYDQAASLLEKLSLDEKISQLLLVRYPKENAIEILREYQFGGYLLFAENFANKTYEEVKKMTNEIQENAKIPLLIASDEEGGKVSRISINPNLVEAPFKSASELYDLGGFSKIAEDTLLKSAILFDLGINLNLAPVIDVSTDENDYIYERTLKKNTRLTSIYAQTVINASKKTGVSYTLKHFPGYGNNKDTHKGYALDKRPFEMIVQNDLPPFVAGINAGAEAVMISHNIVTSIDENNPASVSILVHDLLINELKFSGITITDDITMKALDNISNADIKAIQAGNNIIITTDYQKSFSTIKKAVLENVILEEEINNLALKVLAWKYYKGLLK